LKVIFLSLEPDIERQPIPFKSDPAHIEREHLLHLAEHPLLIVRREEGEVRSEVVLPGKTYPISNYTPPPGNPLNMIFHS
jgi:hypothetical protein